MATIDKLRVGIHDKVSFSKKNAGENGFDLKDRHVAEIVGPKYFPKCAEVYLAPPLPEGGNIYIYDPVTDKRRNKEEIISIDKDGHRTWGPSPMRDGEILIQSIHMGYTLFKRA